MVKIPRIGIQEKLSSVFGKNKEINPSKTINKIIKFLIIITFIIKNFVAAIAQANQIHINANPPLKIRASLMPRGPANPIENNNTKANAE